MALFYVPTLSNTKTENGKYYFEVTMACFGIVIHLLILMFFCHLLLSRDQNNCVLMKLWLVKGKFSYSKGETYNTLKTVFSMF